MDIYAFTNGRPYFRTGWHDEDVITVFSNVTVDLVNVAPAEDAVLSVLVIFGNATVIVPAGAKIAVGGFSMFGGRSLAITPASAGARTQLTLSSVFGNIRVVEGTPSPSIEAPSAKPMTGKTVQLQPDKRA